MLFFTLKLDKIKTYTRENYLSASHSLIVFALINRYSNCFWMIILTPKVLISQPLSRATLNQ